MADFLFYVAALAAILTALGVVVAKNPVMSVTSLLGCFFAVSMIYLLAGFQFIAAIQIMVYAGAIMVLFLFVVMLLNLGDDDVAGQIEQHLGKGPRAKAAIGVAVGMLVLSLIAILGTQFSAVDPALAASGNDPIPELAREMFTRYSLPFEAASVLLLATAVGVMVLAKRQRPGGSTKPGETGGSA
ncbi:MAG: NADH-quinone oxidoreductase subunit J [Planctomycetota bacterium]